MEVNGKKLVPVKTWNGKSRNMYVWNKGFDYPKIAQVVGFYHDKAIASIDGNDKIFEYCAEIPEGNEFLSLDWFIGYYGKSLEQEHGKNKQWATHMLPLLKELKMFRRAQYYGAKREQENSSLIIPLSNVCDGKQYLVRLTGSDDYYTAMAFLTPNGEMMLEANNGAFQYPVSYIVKTNLLQVIREVE